MMDFWTEIFNRHCWGPEEWEKPLAAFFLMKVCFLNSPKARARKERELAQLRRKDPGVDLTFEKHPMPTYIKRKLD